MAYNGLLTLTDQRLSFSPTGRLDRIVGVRELEIPVSLITQTELVGIEKNLVVEFEDRSARFAGQGAKRVFARLDALLSESKAPENTIEFQPGERVLVQGVATSYANGLIATRGEVVLTDKRIRFLTGGGLETLIWTFPELDHPLEAITRAGLSGVRKLLEVWIDGERRIFGGPIGQTLQQPAGNGRGVWAGRGGLLPARGSFGPTPLRSTAAHWPTPVSWSSPRADSPSHPPADSTPLLEPDPTTSTWSM